MERYRGRWRDMEREDAMMLEVELEVEVVRGRASP